MTLQALGAGSSQEPQRQDHGSRYTPGVRIVQRREVIGLHFSGTYEVSFEDCRVPADRALQGSVPTSGLPPLAAAADRGPLGVDAPSPVSTGTHTGGPPQSRAGTMDSQDPRPASGGPPRGYDSAKELLAQSGTLPPRLSLLWFDQGCSRPAAGLLAAPGACGCPRTALRQPVLRLWRHRADGPMGGRAGLRLAGQRTGTPPRTAKTKERPRRTSSTSRWPYSCRIAWPGLRPAPFFRYPRESFERGADSGVV